MFWVILGVILIASTICAVLLMKVGLGSSMAPTPRQRAEWKADAYIAAIFHGTGAPMETVLAERDRYVEELLGQWANRVLQS